MAVDTDAIIEIILCIFLPVSGIFRNIFNLFFFKFYNLSDTKMEFLKLKKKTSMEKFFLQKKKFFSDYFFQFKKFWIAEICCKFQKISFLQPLAIWWHTKECDVHVLIDIILCFLLWLPAILYAVYICFFRK